MIDPADAITHELALCRIASGRPNVLRWAAQIARDALGVGPCDCEADADDDELDPYADKP